MNNIFQKFVIIGLVGFFLIFLPILEFKGYELNANLETYFLDYENIITLNSLDNLLTIQNNSLLPLSSHSVPKKMIVINRFNATITAYSSTICQTDSSPFLTASNIWVRKGIVANNHLAFGTKIRIPSLFDDKIFVVEDRMHPRKQGFVDIWFSSKKQAIEFGIQEAKIEVVKEI